MNQVTGYQVVISTDKKFKHNLKTVATKKTNVTLTKLKKGKVYYIKVRAYKLDANKKKIFGAYSTTKKVSKK